MFSLFRHLLVINNALQYIQVLEKVEKEEKEEWEALRP